MSRNLLQLLSCCCPAAAAAAAAGALLRDLRSTNHKLEMRGFHGNFAFSLGFDVDCAISSPRFAATSSAVHFPNPRICGVSTENPRSPPDKSRYRDPEISSPRISRCGDFKPTDFEMRRFQIHGFRDAEISNPRISRCGDFKSTDFEMRS